MVYLWHDTHHGHWVLNHTGSELVHLDHADVCVAINAALDHAEALGTLAFLFKDDGRLEILNSRVWNGECDDQA